MNYELIIPKGYVKPYLPGLTKWVEALRSGEYKQGRGVLCKDNKYCCLGVLCKINNRPSEMVKFDNSGVKLSPAFSSVYSVLSALGKFPPDVYVRANFNYGNLSSCNDNGLNFLQIADIIEQVWQESLRHEPIPNSNQSAQA